MRKYRYPVWDYLGNETYREITEQEIINNFWAYWSQQIISQHGKYSPLLTKERCIESWCTENYAHEIDP